MSQGIFYGLGGGIAGAGKSAERGNIGKHSAPEAAYVIAGGRAADNGFGCLQRIGGQPQRAGKIVGRAGRDIANGGVRPGIQQTCHRLVKGAVAAAADDQIQLGSPAGSLLPRLTGGGGNVYGHIVVCPVKGGDDVRKDLVCLTHACAGI